MDFIQGCFVKDAVKIELVGTNNKYRYRWMSSQDTNTDALYCLMIDFSWSMYTSKSAQETLDSTKETCNHLFQEGAKEVILIFFGRTAHLFTVNESNYNTQINSVMTGYFDSFGDPNGTLFESRNTFSPNATMPETAFQKLCDYIQTNSDKTSKNILVLMMTDGKFTGEKTTDNIDYKKVWDTTCATVLKTFQSSLSIHCIGYQNDDLVNIKDMKEAFDKYNYNFMYTTVQLQTDIKNAMLSAYNQLMTTLVPSISLGADKLKQYDVLYSLLRYCDNLAEHNACNSSVITGVSQDWVERVLLFEIDIGLKQDSIMLDITKTKPQYDKIVADLVPYYTMLHKKYLELKSEYKSLKSKHIPVWKSLQEKITDLTKLYNNIQSLATDKLNEKKAFELSTQIAGHISSRHLKTLQRRRIHNEQIKKEHIFTIELESKDPKDEALLKFSDNASKHISVSLTSSQEQLDTYYECLYNKDNWTETLNSLFAVPINYVWKESDDWSPSRSNIKLVSASNFVSLDGYKDMQEIFGATEHTKLYKDNSYVKSAHDETNAVIPIATDPFFSRKIHLVKDRLGHMIAGSNYSFANRHILFYCNVIKQCFNQLLETDTEKLQHITLLLLNTFKILSNKLNCFFEKDQKPVSKPVLLLNISQGNTAPYLFAGQFDPAIVCLTAYEKDFQDACDMYNKIPGYCTTQDLFKQRVWSMVYRHMLIASFDKDKYENWTEPKTWDLLDDKALEEKLQLHGTHTINQYMMSEDKLDAKLPDVITQSIKTTTENKITKLFLLMTKFADSLNDDFWSTFNKSFLPQTLKPVTLKATIIITDSKILSEIALNTHWECLVYGQKDCYPYRILDEFKKMVTNIINDKYSANMKSTLADVKELLDFNKRRYETRYLPVTFTSIQTNNINDLFALVYSNKVLLDDFKVQVFKILGERVEKQILEALTLDNVDCLQNLFNYCKSKKHSLLIKQQSKLPYSTPAHPTSSLFLQTLSDNDFANYYRPLGFGWSTKKYRHWVDDLHPFMTENLTNYPLDRFVQITVDHCFSYDITEDKYLKQVAEEATYFYNTFKNLKEKEIHNIYSNHKYEY